MKRLGLLLVGVAFCSSMMMAHAQEESGQLLPTLLPLNVIPKPLRVAVVVNKPSVKVTIGGTNEIRGLEGEPLFIENKGSFHGTMKATQYGIQINQTFAQVRKLELKSNEGKIAVNGRLYTGTFIVYVDPGKGLTFVHDVSVEEYLRGVLPLEVNPRWPVEALKAQAVVARTFALFKAIEKKDQPYMLTDKVTSQVYGGELYRQKATDEAVRLTQGEVLTYQNQIIPAYFHANCGGRTEKADEVWPVVPNPVLQGVVCLYCKGLKHSSWSLSLPLKDIEKVMQKRGYPAKNLSGLLFEDFDLSGRSRKVRLKYPYGESVIKADDFRSFIGNDRLKSLKVQVTVKEGVAHFKGKGWGHGIGFCQWGAKGQAAQGRNYREILLFYLPGSEIMRL